LSWGIKDQYEANGPEAADNTGNLILKNKERQRKEGRNGIKEEEFAIYDRVCRD
jgi:hypothetical protein